MLRISIILLLLGGFLTGQAQLANTRWTSKMNIPSTMETVLDFKKDSLILTIAQTGDVVETMTYTVSGDTLKLVKLDGGSPCDNSTVGSYKLLMKEGKLYISPIADDCYERKEAFLPDAWIRVKEE